MSNYPFANQLIGLAREHNRREKRIAARYARGKTTPQGFDLPASVLVVRALKASGYWTAEQADVFGDSLEGLLQAFKEKKKG